MGVLPCLQDAPNNQLCNTKIMSITGIKQQQNYPCTNASESQSPQLKWVVRTLVCNMQTINFSLGKKMKCDYSIVDRELGGD
jgi:hypothetical protein